MKHKKCVENSNTHEMFGDIFAKSKKDYFK